MELYINDFSVDGRLPIVRASACDNAGGMLDTLTITADSTADGFYTMNPRRGDTIRLIEGSFNSGKMYVDEPRQQRGRHITKALCAPVDAKMPRNQSWQDVDLLGILEEVAARYNMELKTFGIENYRYRRVRQEWQTDFEFLAFRCMLESYSFKVHDDTLIVYNEAELEAQEAQREFELKGEYELVQPGMHYFDAVQLSTTSLAAEARQGSGQRVLARSDIPFYSIGEGERFCNGLMRAENKKRKRLTYSDSVNAGVAAGSVVRVYGEGEAADKYVVDAAYYDFTKGAVRLYERAVL